MWDWELLKAPQGTDQPTILNEYTNADFRYCHVRTYESENSEFLTHNHAMYELVYGVSGKALYNVENETYTLEKDCLLLIAPTVLHKLSVLGNEPFERHTLFINCAGAGSLASRLISQCCTTNGHTVSGIFYAGGEIQTLQEDWDRIIHATSSNDETINALTAHFLDSLIANLLMLVREQNPARFSVGSRKTPDKLVAYLSQHFCEPITVEELATKFYISKDYCNRIFHKATGFSVKQFILYHRVLYARQLLFENRSAAEAAKICGFQSYTSFYRAYKQITGRSPVEDAEPA